MALCDEHKLFLQIFMSNRLLGENEVRHFYCKLFGGRQSQAAGLDETINLINQSIEPFKHNIKKMKCEMTGETSYIYYSKGDQNYNSIDKRFSAGQKSLISSIVHEIIYSETGIISYSTIERLAQQVTAKGSKLIDSLELTNKLLEEQILLRTDDDLLYLSPLAITELDPYLKDVFDNIPVCQLCQSIIVHGVKCHSCQASVHKHCLKQYTDSRLSQSSVCPGCNEDFFLTQT